MKKNLRYGRGTPEAAAKARKMIAEAFWLGRKNIEMTGELRKFADRDLGFKGVNILWKYWMRGNRRFTTSDNQKNEHP